MERSESKYVSPTVEVLRLSSMLVTNNDISTGSETLEPPPEDEY